MKRSILFLALFCSACSLSPTYNRPAMDTPGGFSGSMFIQAKPADDLPKGAWWKIYDDQTLDALEDELSSNQNLQAALQRLKQAQSALGAARAQLFPSLDLGASSQKLQTSKNRATYFSAMPTRYRDSQLFADVSYEPDVFGRLSNLVEASRMNLEATKADLASLKLSLEAELAASYFTLQALRQEESLQKEIVASQTEHVQLIKALFDGGAAAESEFDQAKISLESAQSLEHEYELQDDTLVHAIATLLGKPATGYQVETATSEPRPWAYAALPSKLLERRPDIASAERQVEAANAEVGVAKAAFFPSFVLNANGGFESAQMGNLIQTPSEFWSLGIAAAVNLFDAGLRRSLTEEAKARYEETVANYKQTVLNAYREVEDGMSSLHRLELENASQQAAVDSASKALDQASFGYEGGMSPYQNLVTSRIQYLQAEQQLATLQGRRMTESVLLVKALGGGPE
jgi:outer membrane protein, multidrug efflux system